MALTNSEIKEIEGVVRKEIRNFLETNTVKQFEDKIFDKIHKELKRGKLEGEVKEIAVKMFREFYQFMWQNRSYWEPRLKNRPTNWCLCRGIPGEPTASTRWTR